MQVHDALRGRRTIQRFRPGSVDAAAIDRAIEAAAYAPNHKTTWPFRFVLPGPLTRQRLFEVALRLKTTKKGHSPELEAKVRADYLVPHTLVVVVQVVAGDEARILEDYASCACAVQNLMLSLHADGIATKWATGGPTRDGEALTALGVDPDSERVVAFVWAGLAEIVPQCPKRPPLSDLIRRRP